jgi:hypothetical protein
VRNIFLLTKNEQRVVIFIVVMLLAVTLAKHYWVKRSALKISPSTEAIPRPTHSPADDEQASSDDAP